MLGRGLYCEHSISNCVFVRWCVGLFVFSGGEILRGPFFRNMRSPGHILYHILPEQRDATVGDSLRRTEFPLHTLCARNTLVNYSHVTGN